MCPELTSSVSGPGAENGLQKSRVDAKQSWNGRARHLPHPHWFGLSPQQSLFYLACSQWTYFGSWAGNATTSRPLNPLTLMDGTLPCCVRMKQNQQSFGCIRLKKVKMSLLGRMVKRTLLFSYGLICLAAVHSVNAAENSSQTVRVKIGTILANNQSDEIDPKLNTMKNQLKVMKYRSYRLL